MEINNRKSVFDGLKKYCHHAKEHDFIEVTEWSSGEGFDININGKIIALTYGQLDAINYLTKALDYEKL